jgi:transcriptional regulator with PAS, ATPase and Fis domain
VLLLGESGSGKEVAARFVHAHSKRAGGPFIALNCGAIAKGLTESILEGHRKGAFTGAVDERLGVVRSADHGTLFLDEIGEMPLEIQCKLLRILQERAVMPLGSCDPQPVDFRLVCATNKDLPAMVRDSQFREDLYYRINTVTLQLPPLRERTDEIEPLASLFIERYAKKYRRNVTGISESAVELLRHCRWSGNVRELQNRIEQTVILAENEVLRPDDFQINDSELNTTASPIQAESLEDAEEQVIRNAVKKYNGNLTLVAKALNISRPTLYNRLKKYGI